MPGTIGYQQRSDPDRCEGLYQSPVAGESLELMSFVIGGISFDPGHDTVLIITVPDVSRFQADKVNVRARALPIGVYYRMDKTELAGMLGDYEITYLRSGSSGRIVREIVRQVETPSNKLAKLLQSWRMVRFREELLWKP